MQLLPAQRIFLYTVPIYRILVTCANLRLDKKCSSNYSIGWSMKRFVLAVCLLLPLSACAQNTGRIDCPRNDRADYVYLYSSLTTMEIRSTLDCGAVVTITGRFDAFFAVRTARR